jgi:hypothetical protein
MLSAYWAMAASVERPASTLPMLAGSSGGTLMRFCGNLFLPLQHGLGCLQVAHEDVDIMFWVGLITSIYVESLRFKV